MIPSIMPSVTTYLNMLYMIVNNTTHISDKQWALRERHRMLEAGLIHKVSDDTYLAIKGAEWD